MERIHPLQNRRGASAHVGLTPAPPAIRIALRAGGDALSALSMAIGLDLPRAPKTAVVNGDGDRSVLWLGPDEWLLIDDGENGEAADLLARLAETGVLHSAVDVSHRNTAIMVTGEAAASVLAAGCPQDLSLKAFPVNACSRTVLGKIEVVIWRMADDMFRVECWRSFSDYAFAFLSEAAKDVR
nr:sarcosine oxidase subunit gamma [Pararhizobium haloflavum]